MAIQTPTPLPTMSYEEFLHWADDETHAEWVDGKVVFMEPVSDDNKEESGFLDRTIGTYVNERGLGSVKLEPFQMKLSDRPSGRSPDLIFISTQNLPRIRPTYLDGPADLVIEIVSPDSQKRDRITKYQEYETAGVREYWLIDPAQRSAEFYRLDAGSHFERMPVEDGVFRSEVIQGLWIKIEWLWNETRPRVIQVLKEWGLV